MFKLYKNAFFDLINPKKKRNLHSNEILRVLNKKEMETLKQYWNIIGVSYSMDINVNIEI